MPKKYIKMRGLVEFAVEREAIQSFEQEMKSKELPELYEKIITWFKNTVSKGSTRVYTYFDEYLGERLAAKVDTFSEYIEGRDIIDALVEINTVIADVESNLVSAPKVLSAYTSAKAFKDSLCDG